VIQWAGGVIPDTARFSLIAPCTDIHRDMPHHRRIVSATTTTAIMASP
jgi:hypothetical protein